MNRIEKRLEELKQENKKDAAASFLFLRRKPEMMFWL